MAVFIVFVHVPVLVFMYSQLTPPPISTRTAEYFCFCPCPYHFPSSACLFLFHFCTRALLCLSLCTNRIFFSQVWTPPNSPRTAGNFYPCPLHLVCMPGVITYRMRIEEGGLRARGMEGRWRGREQMCGYDIFSFYWETLVRIPVYSRQSPGLVFM